MTDDNDDYQKGLQDLCGLKVSIQQLEDEEFGDDVRSTIAAASTRFSVDFNKVLEDLLEMRQQIDQEARDLDDDMHSNLNEYDETKEEADELDNH